MADVSFRDQFIYLRRSPYSRMRVTMHGRSTETKKPAQNFCCRFHRSLPDSLGDHVGSSVHRVNIPGLLVSFSPVTPSTPFSLDAALGARWVMKARAWLMPHVTEEFLSHGKLRFLQPSWCGIIYGSGSFGANKPICRLPTEGLANLNWRERPLSPKDETRRSVPRRLEQKEFPGVLAKSW
jgi:hypothetical protein